MSRASTDERRAAGSAAGALLSRSTLMTLRRVLHAYREGWVLEERLAAAARMAAEDARDAQALLGRLVTLAIEAYYGRGRASGRRDPANDAGGQGDARSAA